MSMVDPGVVKDQHMELMLLAQEHAPLMHCVVDGSKGDVHGEYVVGAGSQGDVHGEDVVDVHGTGAVKD